MLFGIDRVLVTSASLTAGESLLAASPALCFSSFVKEPGPGALRTSNTARASASLTSASRARSAGSSGSPSRPQSRQSICSGGSPPAPPRPVLSILPAPPSARRFRGEAGSVPGRLAANAGLPSPCEQCMRSARSGISRAVSSPASSSLSQAYRLSLFGKSGRLLQAAGADRPLRWNSQRIPSRSSFVYIGLPPGPRLGPRFCPRSLTSCFHSLPDRFWLYLAFIYLRQSLDFSDYSD